MTDHVRGFPLSSTFYDATHYHQSPFGGPSVDLAQDRAGTVVTSSVDSGEGLRRPHFIRGPPHGVTIPYTQSRFIKFIFPASHQLLGKPCCVLFFLEIVVMPREKLGLGTQKKKIHKKDTIVFYGHGPLRRPTEKRGRMGQGIANFHRKIYARLWRTLFSSPRPTQRHMLPMIKMIITGQIVYHCSIATNKWASNILTANAIEKKKQRKMCRCTATDPGGYN